MKDYDIKRGDVYYVTKYKPVTGSEQQPGRPAVVVSNNENNKYSSTIEVVYCTTKNKTPLPTHVTIHATSRESTVLCEQITTVSVEHIDGFIGCCDEKEMQQIDQALAISIGLSVTENQRVEEEPESSKLPDDTIATMSAETNVDLEMHKLQIERDTYKKMYDNLLCKLISKK